MKKILKKVMNFIMVAIVSMIAVFGIMAILQFIVEGKVKYSSEDCIILLFMDAAMVVGYYGKAIVSHIKETL